MNGYGGTILRVNLTNKTIKKQPTDPGLAQNYLGGRGFAAYTLYTEVPKRADPLGPENRLIVAPGPLSGLLVPGAGKITFAAKSPATGGYADSSMGGIFCGEFRYAGYDAIIFEGVSPKPVYLFIEDETVELRDASAYWGQGCITAERALKDELGEEFQIAVVGPAAENLVKYACISHDFGRQAGRAGVGTVMGSKKLKAIAVRGTKSIPIADVDQFREQARAMFQACQESKGLEVWQKYGTVGVTQWANEVGAFPTRNFQSGAFEESDNLIGPVFREQIVRTDKGCFSCPSPCGKYSYSSKHNIHVEGPEYETEAFLGGDVGIGDLEDVAYANYLCDEWGLDTISAGNVIAFAMECFEGGLITTDDTDGLELNFGNAQAMFTLIEKIAKREGIGHILAEGSKAAAERFGAESADFAMQIKGLEISGYESRHAPAMLLAYMTCDVGAHHNRAWAITYDIEAGRDKFTEDKAAKVIELQHIRPLFDCLGACRLQWVELGLDLGYYAPILKTITGVDRSWDDLLKISERIWNLTRCFWVREVEGFGREWDYPPARVWKEPVVGGPTAGKLVPKEKVDKLLDMYYEQRGWDKNGIPTEEKLAELGLSDLVEG
ncbi:MAG: aldehyde ferredoxin oxidoreductase family protein [Anaerolineae bacterium]